MRLIIIIILTMVSGLMHASTDTGTVIISGQLKNGNESKAKLISVDNKISHIFKLIDGKFVDTVKIRPGYYSLVFSREYATLYLETGFDLHIEIDMNVFDESITFTGKGEAENNFLAQSYLSEMEIVEKRSIPIITEPEVLAATDTLFRFAQCKLKECVGCTDRFIESHNWFLNFRRSNENFQYLLFKGISTGTKDIVSDSFPDPFKGIVFDDPDMLMIPGYFDLINYKVIELMGKVMKERPDLNRSQVRFGVLDTLIRNDLVKERLVFNDAKQMIDYSENKDSIYQVIMKYLKYDEYRDQVTAHYNASIDLKVGSPSPDFSFADSSGKLWSLTDFRGKYVYMDVWATWCMPCLGEIPELTKLYNDFKSRNIAFVSIAMNDNKVAWRKMVNEKAMTGIQLFADDSKHSFFEKYLIRSIPRFILIDPDGSILKAMAPRPTSPELRPLLRLLLERENIER